MLAVSSNNHQQLVPVTTLPLAVLLDSVLPPLQKVKEDAAEESHAVQNVPHLSGERLTVEVAVRRVWEADCEAETEKVDNLK